MTTVAANAPKTRSPAIPSSCSVAAAGLGDEAMAQKVAWRCDWTRRRALERVVYPERFLFGARLASKMHEAANSGVEAEEVRLFTPRWSGT